MDSWAELDFVTSAAEVTQETKRPLYVAAHLPTSQDDQKYKLIALKGLFYVGPHLSWS
jgi:hypothetical protein